MVSLFSGATLEEGIERAHKRVKSLSKADLLAWLEVAVPGMERHLEMYRRTGSVEDLGELALANMTAYIVITELMEKEGIT
jgi:hypothetical protein